MEFKKYIPHIITAGLIGVTIYNTVKIHQLQKALSNSTKATADFAKAAGGTLKVVADALNIVDKKT